MPANPGLRIGKVFGIPIYLHASWVIIFVLITMSLGVQFTQLHPNWTAGQHWTAGILTSLLFFASVLFHELCHSVVAKHYKIEVTSITLFVFGGVSRIGKDAPVPIQEFNIAFAGPLSSLFLSGAFFSLLLFFPKEGMVGSLGDWLGWTNLALAGFNLLPGFPLDGGRIFRAIVWGITKDFAKATRIAGATGKLIAYAMILFGAFLALKGQWISGIWLAFIGWFLLNASQESVAQIAVREGLAGLYAADVMSHEVPTVPRDMTLEEYSQEVVRTGRRCHLVIADGQLAGMMNVHALNSISRDDWAQTSVQAVMVPREKILWAAPEDPLLGLLERLLSADVNQMPVISGTTPDEAHIVGMITRDSILRVIRARTELGPLGGHHKAS
jgi:Zn-dependent protease/predicted transcriptional regulator